MHTHTLGVSWICNIIHICTNVHRLTECTGWRRLIGCLKLQVISPKRATNYRALLRKMTYQDKASYFSTRPCTLSVDLEYTRDTAIHCNTHTATHTLQHTRCNTHTATLCGSWIHSMHSQRMCTHKLSVSWTHSLNTIHIYTNIYTNMHRRRESADDQSQQWHYLCCRVAAYFMYIHSYVSCIWCQHICMLYMQTYRYVLCGNICVYCIVREYSHIVYASQVKYILYIYVSSICQHFYFKHTCLACANIFASYM